MQIFSELKRASSLSHSQSVTETRPRAVSTDESSRKANMEARQRAIIAASSHNTGAGERPSRSRATSPNPGARGHRRDRSSGGPETRFPVATISSPVTNRGSKTSFGSGVDRNSLEVPSADAAPAAEKEEEKQSATVLGPVTNGSSEFGAPLTTVPDGMEEITLTKRDSLGRSGHATKHSLARKQPGSSSLKRQSLVSVSGGGNNENSGSEDSSRVGVSLTDKPMDD